MSHPAASDRRPRLERERDLYLAILNLDSARDLDQLLAEALALVVDATGAMQGYLEARESEASWWTAHDCSNEEVEGIRSAISRGIISEALATGRTIVTPSALLDPRFAARRSVREHRIDAVLCTPLGGSAALGVLYLQGRRDPGPFSEEDQALAEAFAFHLTPRVDRILAHRRLRAQTDPTREIRERLRLEGVVGHSAALAAVLRQAALVAPLDVNLLLTGESGTGKSQLARLIHDSGPRSAGPFVELNCAAIPEELIENELFGHEAGAYSSAQRSERGKVAAAEGGTLFLDEIGELPVRAQAKLLQLLQSKEYFPLGATRPVRAQVRHIAATNADLELAVKEGRFRQDLFYRLNVLPIRMPSLAERAGDIPELAEHLCAEACARHGLPRLTLSASALHALATTAWPGNVRQLAHALEAAAIRAAGEGMLRVEPGHVFPDARPASQAEDSVSFQVATRRFQRDLLRQVLLETGWNVSEAARRLDLARSHLYNLIKALGLEREG